MHAHWTFSSSTVFVHSASYPPGKANRVAAYQWWCCGVNTAEQKKLCLYTASSFPIRYIHFKINFFKLYRYCVENLLNETRIIDLDIYKSSACFTIMTCVSYLNPWHFYYNLNSVPPTTWHLSGMASISIQSN